MVDTERRVVQWRVAGMDCPSCAGTLERACETVPGVTAVRANVATGKLRVVVEPGAFEPAALAAAAERAGHPLLAPDAAGGAAWHWLGLGVAALTLAVAADLLLPPPQAEAAAPALYILATVLSGMPLLPKAYAALRHRAIDMNVLMAVALLGALALGDWTEAATLAVLFGVAQWLERRSLGLTGRAVESLLELAPRRARREVDGAVDEVEVETVAVGDTVRVRPGDLVPLDGVLLDGSSAVDEATITGESMPVAKSAGDTVYAGTLALDGAFRFRVTRAAHETTLSRVVELVEQAQAEPSRTARLIDRFAAWYTPLVVLLAVGVAFIPPLLGGELAVWFYRGLVLLVIGCPCALVIATPVAIYSGLTAAARRGVLVRGGDTLERLAAVRAVALDKTGTLTRGKPRLQQVLPLNGAVADEALALAAALEGESSHPLALAIRQAAAERGLAVPPAEGLEAQAGRGVSGTIGGVAYTLSSARDGAAVTRDVAALEQQGMTTMVLAGATPLAVLAVADEPRAGVADAVARLRDVGVQAVCMLTGDNPRAAAAVAQQAGIDDVRAGLLPADKQAAIRELSARYGAVAMVGDGINDAPALATADVGIAIGAAGSDIALETADVALLGDDLHALPELLLLARRVRRTMVANIVIAFAIRLVLVPLAVAGHVALPVAILGDMGGSLLVTVNSLRLLRTPRPR